MLEDYQRMVSLCSKCGGCRVAYRQNLASCPSGDKFVLDSYYALGRMEIARSLIEGRLEWSKKIAQRFYTCLLCRQCEAHCYDTMGLRTSEVFLEVRRELVKRGLGPPPEQNPMIESIKQYDNPYLGDPKNRGKWARNFDDVKSAGDATDTLFFVGCAIDFDPSATFIARSTASLLNKSGIDWGILGEKEICCGFPVLEQGCEEEFKRLAEDNLRRLNQLPGVKTIVTACPGCYHTIKQHWSRYGALNPELFYITEYLHKLIEKGRLRITGGYSQKLTLHDACLLGRYNGMYDAPREILKAIPGVELVEMERSRQEAWCCGAGGGVFMAYPEWASEVATQRLEEAVDTAGANVLVMNSCPMGNLSFDVALHGYGSAVKLYREVWRRLPSTAKFLSLAHKVSAPLLKRHKKIDIQVVDLTALLDQVTE